MPPSAEDVRFILGLKLKNLRLDKGYSLKDISQRAGLSISYLSEIEKGKKYPKPEKLLQLAQALDVPFDDLVSMKTNSELDLIKEVFNSTLIREFPFELFGLASQDLFGLITYDPTKAAALVHTFLDIGRTYDVQVEHFLFAALRSFQQMSQNYFEALEEEALAFRADHDWPRGTVIEAAQLRRVLEEEYGYTIEDQALANHDDLSGFRSVFTDEKRPTLFVNARLRPVQLAFLYGREIGFQRMQLTERPRTSSWIQAHSFDQVLNNFKASYFSGALFIDRDRLRDDVSAFIQRDRWDDQAFLDVLRSHQGTPEMFFYRLTQIIPKFFKLRGIFFVRFRNEAGTDRFRLTKVLNLASVAVPHGMAYSEHYCRRWPAVKVLHELAARQQQGDVDTPLVRVQRSRFIDEDAEFFVISLARPLSLTQSTNSCVSLGFLMNSHFKRTVRFWNDPAISQVDVNLTCERCPLSPADCTDRVAEPTIYRAQREQERKKEALRTLQANYKNNT